MLKRIENRLKTLGKHVKLLSVMAAMVGGIIFAMAISSNMAIGAPPTPPLNVNVTNTPNVSVVNTPTVNIDAILTHMGQPASNMVTLEDINTGNGLDFRRIFPNGTEGGCDISGCFRVPAGKVLIVTDVDWQYNLGGPNQVQTLRLSIENLAQPSIPSRVFESTITLNNVGQGGISESMTSGFAVSSDGKIVVDTFPGGGVISHIILRGYLAPDI